ncbi:MAG TPA: DUF480 domain-containing protein, partial [Pirellulales bacterium]
MSDVSRGSSNAPQWRPLAFMERRVLGVLIEKAKTTPDVYPLTVNGLIAGCNQKSNRDPVFTVESDQVDDSLEKLRQLGVVAEVQGTGRVPKYRHYAYEWLDVNKVELGVMCELLLRGEQTEGELRARVSRMDPINDLPTLRTVLDGLKAKNLVVSLTPAGRGHVVAHTLYLPQELERLRTKYAGRAAEPYEDEAPDGSGATSHAPAPAVAAMQRPAVAPASVSPTATIAPTAAASHAVPVSAPSPVVETTPRVDPAEVAALKAEVAATREAVAQLKSDYAALAQRLAAT